MPPKPKGLTSKKMAEASEEGGIDVLPDALLQHILSFLSADEAVKTCVLSRRWRHLWKSTPILRIVKTEDRWDWESFQDFNRFVNTLLVHRGRSRISKFELEFSSLGGYEFDLDSTIFPHFMIWIMYALICQVQVLKIHNFMFTLIEMDGSMPLVSQHLMKIELSGRSRIVMTTVVILTLATVQTVMVVVHIFRSDLRWCPFFSKLKSLLLNEWCVANNFWALACVLKHSPVLENFTLQISKDTKSMIETEENYNVLLKPAITSKHLKVVKVHCTEVDEGVYKIVKFLTTLNIEVVIKRMDRSTKRLHE
uniref:F-box family protein n=1 Tax=Oryza australiensis TaxID=4532 RepID=B9V0G7_9ORYZ|nr:F-box family protein [Oryza australiensis]